LLFHGTELLCCLDGNNLEACAEKTDRPYLTNRGGR
jgi:hypothetical protein